MNLGGDDWPIKLEPSGEEGKEGITVNLKQEICWFTEEHY